MHTRERVKEFFGSTFNTKNAFGSDEYEITHGGIRCLNFEFIIEPSREKMPFIKIENKPKPRILKVSRLAKCNGVNGDSLLKMIDQLAASIPFVEYITLTDRAHVMICGVDINLAHLKILTTGTSWYNRFGYKSSDHHDNVSHNAVVINETMDNALERAKRLVDFERSIEIPRKELFNDLPMTMPVKNYVQAVLDSVRHFPETKEKCTSKQTKMSLFLKSLIYHLSDNLRYNWDLMKIVERDSNAASPRAASPRAASPRAASPRSPRAASTRAASPNASRSSSTRSPRAGGKRKRSCKRNKCKHNKRITKRK
jgi:hypothetical protein